MSDHARHADILDQFLELNVDAHDPSTPATGPRRSMVRARRSSPCKMFCMAQSSAASRSSEHTASSSSGCPAAWCLATLGGAQQSHPYHLISTSTVCCCAGAGRQADAADRISPQPPDHQPLTMDRTPFAESGLVTDEDAALTARALERREQQPELRHLDVCLRLHMANYPPPGTMLCELPPLSAQTVRAPMFVCVLIPANGCSHQPPTCCHWRARCCSGGAHTTGPPSFTPRHWSPPCRCKMS